MNFTVKVLDLELFELLPEGYIDSKGKDGFLNAHVVKGSGDSIAYAKHLKIY